MARRSARSVWFASWLLCFLPAASANGIAAGDPSLSLDQSALAQPDAIAAWLKRHAATADRRMAQRYLEMGRKAERQRNWSRATKAFGESALFFPTPGALRAYGDNLLRDLGQMRARSEDASHAGTDLGRGLAVYRSALAADAQLKALPESARAQLKADESCLSDHLARRDSGKSGPAATRPASACRPLELYGTAR